jgi:hypothetical protein
VGSLEAVELGLRAALLQDARRLLEALYQDPTLQVPDQAGRPGEKRHPLRPKVVETLFGPITLQRDYFHHAATQAGRVPLDDALGLVQGYSPALVRLACRAAARLGYENASTDLAALAQIQLEGRQIQRLVQLAAPAVAAASRQVRAAQPEPPAPIPILYIEVDGTGVPMVAAELAGRAGKQPDGSAKTREVKLGAVFTQTRCDAEGRPERDHQSTTYVGSFAPAADFGVQIRTEARRRGLGRAGQVVVLGDGAAWIWELARVNFPDGVQILDLFHVLERLHALGDGLYGPGSAEAARQVETWREWLKQDQVEAVIAAARARRAALDPPPGDALDKQIAFFEHHRHRMLYQTYRNRGFFCGSGVIEAGCKTVVGQRLKQSGMFWSEPGAQNVLDLRCLLLSQRWDPSWDHLHQPTHPPGTNAAA